MQRMLIADQLSGAILICKWVLSPNKELALSLGREIRGLPACFSMLQQYLFNSSHNLKYQVTQETAVMICSFSLHKNTHL